MCYHDIRSRQFPIEEIIFIIADFLLFGTNIVDFVPSFLVNWSIFLSDLFQSIRDI